MKKLISPIVLLFATLFVSTAVFAQPGGDLPSEEVEIIKDFEARLEESNKLVVKPEMPPIDTTTKNLVYDIPSKNIEVEYLPPKIRPIAMKRQPLPPTYKGYAKLGYGIPSSPYAELAYHTSDPEKYEAGLSFLHHSANFKDIEHQRFANTHGKVEGTYFHPEGYAIGGNIGYGVDEVHFYGYDHEAQSYQREQIRQQFKAFDLGVKFFNGERTNGDLNYHAGADFYSLQDNYASGETNLDIDLGVTKWFNETHPLKVRIVTDFTTFEDTVKQKLNNFYLQPSFTWHGDAFKVKVGANITSTDDVFSFYPDVEASVNVVGNKLNVFAGAEGGLHKNSFRSLSGYNPFMVSRGFEIRNTSYNNFYGGIRGNLQVFDYKVQAGYKQADDLATYLNDPFDTLRFAVIYDTVNIFYVKGTLNATPVEGLDVIITAGQNVYDFKNLVKAFHLPALELNVGVVYTTLEEKLRLKGELYIENGVPFLTRDGQTDNLNGLFDISLGADYRLTEHFGLFFQVNNLANNKRQRWANYPTYGINILGGLTARF